MLLAIDGIEIPLDCLVGEWKVSQNRSESDCRGVAQGLAGESTAPLAAAMAALVRKTLSRP